MVLKSCSHVNGNARSDREFWGGSIVQMQIDIEGNPQDKVVLKAYNPDISYFYYPAYSPEWRVDYLCASIELPRNFCPKFLQKRMP